MKPVIILLIFLVLSLTALQLCSKQIKLIKPSTDTVQIIDGKNTVNIPKQAFLKEMTQKAKAKRGSKWSGVYLSKFLTDNGFDLKKYKNCTLVARDGMRVTIPIDEVIYDQAFLTFTADKKSTRKELKLVMLQDDFEQRWLKYIHQIILE
jgi:hypothetical protein